MCGICGSTRAMSDASLAAMNMAMRHRGPDDVGVHFDPHARVAIGARRLSIVDLAGGHQPLSNETGRVWAVLNGEIYNHSSLRESLERMGHRFASATDTEVLVHLYEEYGADLVHALEGMYAFAVWDSEQGRLLIARDRFGEKPLYYTQEGGDLLFASELDALRAGAPARDELSEESVDAFFVHGYVPGPGSILRGAHQLPPAHSLQWSRAAGVLIARYWRPPSARHGLARELDEELVGEAEHHLQAAVASRMIADVPVGVFLSGGIDSTLLATLAARRSRAPIQTFTVGYDVGAVSELDAARDTAARLGSEHHELRLCAPEVAVRVPAVLARLDHPLADQALVPLQAVAELARTQVTVALGGEGADELFAGYPRYRWLARASAGAAIVPPQLATLGARALARSPLGARGARLADVLAPRPTIERHLDWVTSRRREYRAGLYGPRLSALATDTGVCEALAARVDVSGEGELDTAQLMRLDQLQWLPDDVLLKADRAGMLVSLEVRAPYLSRELAEFAAGVAPSVHLAGAGKQLLRRVLDRVAPAAPRRPKTAFRAPAADWLRGPLAPAMAEQVRAGALYEEGWFARAPVARLIREHADGARDHAALLWPLLALGLWLDRWRGVAEA
ncbi:MAG: asparagine synthase (glutamine-hydrolyzing) [Solirubrobacterales bacterium]